MPWVTKNNSPRNPNHGFSPTQSQHLRSRTHWHCCFHLRSTSAIGILCQVDHVLFSVDLGSMVPDTILKEVDFPSRSRPFSPSLPSLPSLPSSGETMDIMCSYQSLDQSINVIARKIESKVSSSEYQCVLQKGLTSNKMLPKKNLFLKFRMLPIL